VERIKQVGSDIPSFIEDATRFYMEFHDEYQGIQGCVINDPLTLALTFAPDLCDYEEYYVDVDISGGVSMGKTFADFYKMNGMPANMNVAMGVRPRDFIDLFVERMQNLSRSLNSDGVRPR
jgi:purine nucleosidase